MDLFTSTKAMAEQARASGRVLKLVTNSGSVYLLSPTGEKRVWMISRSGIDGRQSIEFGGIRAGAACQGRDRLVIGGWTTTGLKSVELL